MYLIKLSVVFFVSYLQHVGCFIPRTFVSSTNKTEVALNTCNPIQSLNNSSSVYELYMSLLDMFVHNVILSYHNYSRLFLFLLSLFICVLFYGFFFVFF